MEGKPMLRSAVLAGVVSLVSSVCAADIQVPEGAAVRVFERMHSLAGVWQGTYEWSGTRSGSGKLRVAYHLTGGGSALVEDLLMGEDDTPTMTTVYHLDGAELRMTHYCAARNQPRLRAARVDEAAGSVSFSFVDVTNASANPAYVDGFSMHMIDADHLNIRFEFGGLSGKRATENIVVERVRTPAHPS
jgi:hypothetical protein